MIDDHSRFLVDSDARCVFKAADVVASFHGAAAAHGFPAQMLTDIQPESSPQVLGSVGRRHEDREDRRPSTVVDDPSERTARLLAC